MNGGDCPSCRAWPLATQALFCGGCGAPVLGVSLTLERGGDGSPYLAVVAEGLPDGVEGFLAFAVGQPAGGPLSPWPDPIPLRDALDAPYPLLEFDSVVAGPALIEARVVADAEPGSTGRTAARLVVDGGPPDLRVETTVLQADALRIVPGGAWLHVRVRNFGPAVNILKATLKLDLRTGGGAPQAAEPIVVLAHETAVVAVWLDAATTEVLANPGGRESGLVSVYGQDGWLAGGRVLVVRGGKASAALRTRGRIAALAARPLRLPLRLENTGDQPLTLVGVRLLGDGEAVMAEATAGDPALAGDAARPLGPGERMDLELRAVLPAPGDLALRLAASMRTADGHALETVQPILIEVRPADHAFAGRICVDFGTSESAAAVVFAAPDAADVTEAPEPPAMIDLRLASVDGLGKGSRFLPSYAARLRGGGMVFGEAALAADPATIQGQVFKSLKWMLRRNDADGFAIAVAYLRRLKAQIEEHPDIAAVIGPQTVVLATCPTRFPPGRRASLVAALIAAGFPDPTTDVFDGDSSTLIAESWSPLPYALIRDSRRLKSLVRPEVQRETLSLASGQTGHVVVFDVGAGSADLSVLRVRYERAYHTISETARLTDLTFVGEAFGKELVASFEAWARRRRRGLGPVDPRRLIQVFQFDNGFFGQDAVGDAVREHFDAVLAGDRGEADDNVLHDVLFGDDHDAALRAAGQLRLAAQRFSPLYLGDGEATLDGEEDVVDLADRILADFTRTHLRAVERKLAPAIEGAKAAGGPMIFIPSGRGAAFPLARLLLIHIWRRYAGPDAPVCILQPLAAKSITSWGGLYLADLAERDARFGIDLSYEPQLLAFAGLTLDGTRRLFDALPWADRSQGLKAAIELADLRERHLVHRGGGTGVVRLYLGDLEGDDQEPLQDVSVPRQGDGWLTVELGPDHALLDARVAPRRREPEGEE